MNKQKIKHNLETCEFDDNEDAVVLKFLDDITKKNSNISFLEVGSGTCRFTKKLSNLYKTLKYHVWI